MKNILVNIAFLLIAFSSLAQPYNVKDIKKSYVPCLDNQIYYEEVGQGKPIILLHAGFLDCSTWDDQFLHFANQGFRVIRFDSYAHGRSIDSKNTPFLHEMVKSIVDSVAKEKVHLIGTSLGGVSIIEFALNHPEDIDKMVLVSPGINGYPFGSDTLFVKNYLIQADYKAKNDSLQVAEWFLRSWFDGPYRKPSDMPKKLRAESKKIIMDRYRNHGISINALYSFPDAFFRYSQIKNKTLILIGDQDMPSIRKVSKLLQKGIVGSKLVDIKGVGHMINMEIPDTFNKTVLSFLKE